MESQENLYSKEFIEQLNNASTQKVTKKPFLQKPGMKLKIVIAVVVLLVGAIFLAMNAYTTARSRDRINLIKNLRILTEQSATLTKQYQDRINDVKIRIVNEHFYQSLFGISNDVTAYTEQIYTKEQLKTLQKELSQQKDSLVDITERLHKADLNEALAATYLQELSMILQQVIDTLHRTIRSRYYNADFTASIEAHYTQMLKIQQEVIDLENAKVKK